MNLLALIWAPASANEIEAPAAEAPAAEAYPVRYEGQVLPDQPHYDLELLYHHDRFEEGLAAARAALAEAPGDKDLYWLAARFMYEIGERDEDPSVDKVAYYQEMVATAEAGLALAPDDAHLRFARGIGMGRLGTTRGVLASLWSAKGIEADWLAVVNSDLRYSSIGGQEQLPCDAYHALGIFYRLVPDWWAVQLLAGTRGDLQRSLEFNTQATRCKADSIQNWKELAATQLCLGQRGEDEAMTASGLASLERALAIPARNDRQRIDHQHAKKMRDDPSIGCEYSRDGQQDLDRKKLER